MNRLEQLLADLLWLSEQDFLDGAQRDAIASLRHSIYGQLDE